MPITVEITTTAIVRYRLGTSSPISMFAIRLGNTSETIDCRTAQTFTRENIVATANEPSASSPLAMDLTRHTSRAPSASYHR